MLSILYLLFNKYWWNILNLFCWTEHNYNVKFFLKYHWIPAVISWLVQYFRFFQGNDLFITTWDYKFPTWGHSCWAVEIRFSHPHLTSPAFPLVSVSRNIYHQFCSWFFFSLLKSRKFYFSPIVCSCGTAFWKMHYGWFCHHMSIITSHKAKWLESSLNLAPCCSQDYHKPKAYEPAAHVMGHASSN